MSLEDKNKRWSTYWEKGHVTSFGKGKPNNYKSEIKSFWFNQFETTDNGATILDTATGNGAVAMLAIEYSETFSKDFNVLAADAAVINDTVSEEGSTLSLYRDKIQFFSSTPCEQLPFKDASIDLVCSQFGIEYSNLSDSIPEVSRVLTQKGKFAAIMHHHKSVTLLDTRRDIEIINEALNSYNTFDILRQYFLSIGDTTSTASIQTARQQPAVINQEKKLFGVVNKLKESYPDNKALTNFLDSINRFTMNNIGRPEKERLSELNALQDNYTAMIDRQNDLLMAAMSEDSMDKLRDIMYKTKLKKCDIEECLDRSSQIIGWCVNAGM